MTKEEAIKDYITPSIINAWNEKTCKEILQAIEEPNCNECIFKKEWSRIGKLLSVILEKNIEVGDKE